MREFDSEGLKLCQMQGELFALSVDRVDCSSPVFVRRFMNSRLAQRMDADGFLLQASALPGMLQEVEEEYGSSSYGKIKYGSGEMYWMGYLYRYWCYVFEMTSSSVFKLAGSRELHELYFPYHSLDPKQAIERIAEAKGIKLEEDALEKGVAALRRIRAKRGYQYYFVDLGSGPAAPSLPD